VFDFLKSDCRSPCPHTFPRDGLCNDVLREKTHLHYLLFLSANYLKTFTSSMYNQIFTCKKNFLIANDETEQKLNADCFIRTVLFNKIRAE
jgi:hypothetical protein